MPGRRRIKILARGSEASTLALRGRLGSALPALDIHVEDSPLDRRQDPESTGRDHLVSMDIRLRRSQDAGAASSALRGAAALQGVEVTLTEHECFHGLEDEGDFAPCSASLTVTRIVDGTETTRGANGRQ